MPAPVHVPGHSESNITHDDHKAGRRGRGINGTSPAAVLTQVKRQATSFARSESEVSDSGMLWDSDLPL